MKETLINQGVDRSRKHNAVWARIDFSGGTYAYRIHPHGVQGRRAASEDATKANNLLNEKTGSRKVSKVEVGEIKLGQEYVNENFSTKVHGETDGTRHVKKSAT